MKCSKCGNELKDGINFCPMCNNNESITIDEQNIKEPVNKGKQFINGLLFFIYVGMPIITLTLNLFSVPYSILNIVYSIQVLGIQVALPFTIYATIKYIKNIFAKILLLLSQILFIIIMLRIEGVI